MTIRRSTRARSRLTNVGDGLDLVRHRRGEDDADAERLEPLREPRRVRVHDVAGDDLVADREEGRAHHVGVCRSVSSPRRAHIPGRWGRSEAGANPALSRNCDALLREDEPGRLLPADELSPRRKGGSRGDSRRATSLRYTRRFFMVRYRIAGAAALAALVLAAPRPRTATSRPRTRIVSLSPTATEDLFAIGAGKQVVAVDDQSNYPASAPKTKLSGYTPNAEAIAAYKPDLVVALRRRERHRRGAREAEDPGARSSRPPTNARRAPTPSSTQLGKATGHRAGAAAVVARMKSGIARRSSPRCRKRAAAHRLPRARARLLLGHLEDVHRADLHAARTEGHRRRGRQERLRLPEALGRVHRRGRPRPDRPRRHDVLRPDRGEGRRAARLEHDRGREERRRRRGERRHRLALGAADRRLRAGGRCRGTEGRRGARSDRSVASRQPEGARSAPLPRALPFRSSARRSCSSSRARRARRRPGAHRRSATSSRQALSHLPFVARRTRHLSAAD